MIGSHSNINMRRIANWTNTATVDWIMCFDCLCVL